MKIFSLVIALFTTISVMAGENSGGTKGPKPSPCVGSACSGSDKNPPKPSPKPTPSPRPR